ncbi:MAG: magnesium transporter [Elusimicrobiota bacterium]
MPERTAGTAMLRRFIDIDAQQAALSLEAQSPAAAASLLRELGIPASAACLQHTQLAFTAQVLETLLPEPASSILGRMSPDRVADVFRSMSDAARQASVGALTPELKTQVQEILSYPEDSAGRIMKTDVAAFHKDLKVKEVIARLRAQKRFNTYTYVVGDNNKLVGVLNMRDLILADASATVESIMRTEVFSVAAFTDREEIMHQVSGKNLISIPVIDPQGRLIGAIRSEDLLESSHEEATEDLQMLFGASGEERVFSPLGFKVGRRLPWLTVNLGTAFIAAAVVSHFEPIIGRVAVLAVFLPVVAGQGGNAGIQTLSVVLRALVMREVRPKDDVAVRLILTEVGVGLANGVAIGVVTALAAWLWKGNPYLGLVVGLAMVVNMVAAGLAGAGIPLMMKRLGFDPAQSSGIFLTTVTDVVGFFAFLGLATMLEGRLL